MAANSRTSDIPDFVNWPAFPFEGDLRLKPVSAPADTEPARRGEEPGDCSSCLSDDDAYLWANDRWRVKAPPKPSGLPVVIILETRAHLDLGDLSTMHAAELGVLTVRLERAIRSLDSVARVHVCRWGDGSAHLQLWFLARPRGHLQLRGPFMTMWDDILPPTDEAQWREDLDYITVWLDDSD